ncbi:MAG: peroxidase family protein [Kofleriaceae bacterium]
MGRIAAVTLAGLAASPGAQADEYGGEVRSIDGRNNNLAHPDWATPGSHLLREASGAHYADGISSLARPDAPSARAVSSAIFPQTGLIPSHLGISDYIWTFGQFVDHDLGLTEGNVGDGLVDSFIRIPRFDPFFDPFGTGTQVMPFHRGLFDPATGQTTPRQQINEITGYLDASNVYGDDPQRAAWLRAGVGGKLKVLSTNVGDLTPFNDGTMPNAGSPERPDTSTSLFVAGDIRVNEQPTLAAMHILFLREHNYQATRLGRRHPEWSDERLYQAARAIVIAELQHITVDEFIPALLGNAAGIGPYTGYNPNVNAGISSVFSTAAYRLGHTLLSPSILRLGADGAPLPIGPLRLRDSFFSAAPPLILADGIEPFLRGIAAQRSQELDARVIDEVRNFLFGLPGTGGLDLVALNVQRGRDLGLADFNTVRADFGLRRLTRFSQITRDRVLASRLQRLYGDIDNIDPFVGLLVEDRERGYNVGPTLRAVLVDQFVRMRAGDRFWYERTLSGDELERVQRTRLSDIIVRNTSIRRIQRNVFFVPGFAQP